ncbi:hypothetical protein [Synechococcus sp. H55.10]|uniref:hypothetical protein n=1 Tax=Synechococcus sp. H55.10 TaxID=2964503 RepID=UPI0039C70757
MVVSDPLGLVVQEVQRGGYADRVKKLVYFACTSTWEGDIGKLSQIDLKALLEQLCREHATLDALGQRFRDAISRINKKAEYARIAKMLLSKLEPLYQQPQADPSVWAQPSPVLSLKYGGLQLQKQDYDPFELRAGVMRQASPLRVKLVLFTALYHKVEPTLQGLAALRRYSLDELLTALYRACNSPQELETRLKEAVQQSQEPDQDGQAANAVLQMLKPLYVSVPPETAASGGLAAEPASVALDWLDTEDAVGAPMTWVEDGEDPSIGSPALTALATSPNPSSDLRQAIPESCRQLLHRSAGSLMVAIENTLSELGNALDEGLQDEDPAQYLTLKHQVLRGFLRDVEGSAAMFRGILKKLEQSEWRLVQPLRGGGGEHALPEVPGELVDPYASLRQVLASSELTRQKPQLEQEVMRLVRRSVSSVKAAIEQALSELGQALDEQFPTCSLEEALVLKYQALRAFLQEVEEISTKFAALLERMEEAERRLFGLV